MKKTADIRDSIMLLGNRTDVERYYQAMDVFVFPSQYEGLGMAAIEAQACGLRVVASTEVPAAVRISNNVVFLPLSAGAKTWAQFVQGEAMDGSDYDIESQAPRLSEYYYAACKKRR